MRKDFHFCIAHAHFQSEAALLWNDCVWKLLHKTLVGFKAWMASFSSDFVQPSSWQNDADSLEVLHDKILVIRRRFCVSSSRDQIATLAWLGFKVHCSKSKSDLILMVKMRPLIWLSHLKSILENFGAYLKQREGKCLKFQQSTSQWTVEKC